MNLIKKIGLVYLKGIDAAIRFFGAYVIMCVWVLVIYGLCLVLSSIPDVGIDAEYLAGVVSLILLPLIVKVDVLGGGLTVLLIRGKRDMDKLK